MEGALIVLARKLGLDPTNEAAAWPRRATVPFESERQHMATAHAGPRGGLLIVKGAVERLLPMCRTVRAAEGEVPLDPDRWRQAMAGLARRGQRVIALAVRPLPAGDVDLAAPGALQDLVLLGLVGLIDPPRPEAVRAVARCREAGIAVKMITGDHAITACAIAREIGLAHAEVAVEGAELATLDDAALARCVAAVDVFARVAPEQKLRLVEALQDNRATVAMTGDGVNDAPALKRADIGIAMGARGTEAAKEAARMVLADDNFATIEAAIEEGRIINDNLRKAIVFNLPANGGQAACLLIAILIGAELPITPIQILWVNMVSAVTLGLALAFEPGERAIMTRPPRRHDAPLLGPHLQVRVLLVSLLLASGALAAFFLAQAAGLEVARARTAAVNMLVAMEVFYLLSCQRLAPPWFHPRELWRNRAIVAAIAVLALLQLLFTYAPPLQALFATRALTMLDWLLILAAAALVLPLSEWAEARLAPRAIALASTT